jgi:hypothetical protein
MSLKKSASGSIKNFKYVKNNYSLFVLPPQQEVRVEGEFLTHPPRQERTHILFQRGPL